MESLRKMDDDSNKSREKINEVLTFEWKGRILGIWPGDLLEIVEESLYVPVPKAPHFLKGIMTSHGRVVSVIDFAKLMDTNNDSMSGDLRVVILKDEDLMLGLNVPSNIEIRFIEGNKVVMGNSEKLYFFERIKFLSVSSEDVLDILNASKIYEYIKDYFKSESIRSV